MPTLDSELILRALKQADLSLCKNNNTPANRGVLPEEALARALRWVWMAKYGNSYVLSDAPNPVTWDLGAPQGDWGGTYIVKHRAVSGVNHTAYEVGANEPKKPVDFFTLNRSLSTN